MPCDLSSSSQLLAPSLAARATVHAQPRGKVLKPLVSEFAQVVTVRGPSALLPSGSKLAAAFVLPPQVQAFPQVPCLPAGSKCIRAFPLGVDVGPTAPTKVLPTCVRQHLLQHLLRSCQSKCHQCPHTVHLLLPMHLLLWALLHLQRFFHLVLQHPRQHLLRSCQSMLRHHPRTVHLLVPMHQPPCLWVL